MADEQGAIPEGMKAWAGGESAPADWDGGQVMTRDGSVYLHNNHPTGRWLHGKQRVEYYPHRTDLDIIAYTPAADRLTDTGERFVQMVADLRHLTSEDFDARYPDFARDVDARGPAWGKPTAQDCLAVLIDHAIAALVTPKPPVNAGAIRERCALVAESVVINVPLAPGCADGASLARNAIVAAIRNLPDAGEPL